MDIIHDQNRYGFHVSKLDGTFYKSIEYVIKHTPYNVIQIYLSNSRSHSSSFDLDDIIKTREMIQFYNLQLVAHGNLLYNLCGAPLHRDDPKFDFNLKNTTEQLSLELDVIVALGGNGVVVHPNSCQSIDKGLFTASKMIENVLKRNTPITLTLSKRLNINMEVFKKQRIVILENSAHEGNKRGWNLDELSKIINGVSEDVRDQVKICIDTAHAFGAGIYDFGSINDIHKFYKDFEEGIGIKKLHMFHLNDSRKSLKKANNAFFGSCKDRHEHLGLGYIFDENDLERTKALIEFFKQAYERNIHIIGEPPSSMDDSSPSPGSIRDWQYVQNLLNIKNDKLKLLQ